MLFHMLPLTGVMTESPACATPGTAAAACSTRSKSAARSAGFISPCWTLTSTTSTLSRSKPRSRCASAEKVRTNRPAATTSTSDSATCPTTSELPSPTRRSPATPRPCSFSASFGSTRVARNAGTVPNRITVPIATAAVKPSTRQSSERSRKTVLRLVESWRTSRALPHMAKASPSEAPIADSTRLSDRNWRASRQRDAPSATRTLSSWRRAVARASSRLAMFAHAMSSTSPTTIMMAHERPLVAPPQGGRAGGRRGQREPAP